MDLRFSDENRAASTLHPFAPRFDNVEYCDLIDITSLSTLGKVFSGYRSTILRRLIFFSKVSRSLPVNLMSAVWKTVPTFVSWYGLQEGKRGSQRKRAA